MISLNFDMIMDDVYSIDEELLLTIKSYIDCGVTLWVDIFGRVWLYPENNFINYIGKMDFNY